MQKRLDDLLIESICPAHLTKADYIAGLKRPVGKIEQAVGIAAQEDLVRIVRSWPDKDSPLSRCRLISLMRQLKYSAPFPADSMGELMLKILEKSIPPNVNYIARLHEMGFSCFMFAYDLYDLTLKAFRKEKGVELDLEFAQPVFQTFLLAVYHLGRSRMLPTNFREVILFGVHDSYNMFYLRPLGLEPVVPAQLAASYEAVVERWIEAASGERKQSPNYALVRSVFDSIGLMAPIERMACATLLEASANHMHELSEVLQQTRASAGM